MKDESLKPSEYGDLNSWHYCTIVVVVVAVVVGVYSMIFMALVTFLIGIIFPSY